MVEFNFTDQEIFDKFPAPTYRLYQREVIQRIGELFRSGYKCVLIDAPCGFGKSHVNATFCRLMKSFYATPQLTLIDQIKRDKYIGKYFTEIKGRQNYYCRYDPDSTVNLGVCYRNRSFKCDKIEVCPYWIQKMKAIRSQSILCSFAYLVQEGMSEGKTPPFLGTRELLVLDEAHSLDKYLIDYVSVDINPFDLPKIYDKVKRSLKVDSDSEVKFLVETIVEMSKSELNSIQMTLDRGSIPIADAVTKIKLEDFIKSAQYYLTDTEHKWIWNEYWVTYKNEKCKCIKVQPLFAKHFAPELVWDKAEYFIISSATILDAKHFITETGLDKVVSSIKHLKVPSTFPPENRPIVKMWEATGKMTKDSIDENLPKAVVCLKQIKRWEEGKNIAVHCHSYEIAQKFYELCLNDPELKDVVITHNSENRQDMLEEWMSSRGKIFICVSFEEGQDWIGEICGAQVLLKVPFMDLDDKRVAVRLEMGHWNWYYIEALKETIQAYGRAVRSAEDKKKFYVLDGSFYGLIRRTRKWCPDWFKDAMPQEWLL